MSELSFYDLTYDGPVVQAILDTAQKLRTDGYIFMGAGTPSTAPGTPTQRVWYLCGPGTYANFGSSVTVPEGSVMVASYASSAWTKTVVEVTSGTFATGESLSGMSIFDDASDLDGKTTVQKGSMIPNGNMVSAIEDVIGSTVYDTKTIASDFETHGYYKIDNNSLVFMSSDSWRCKIVDLTTLHDTNAVAAAQASVISGDVPDIPPIIYLSSNSPTWDNYVSKQYGTVATGSTHFKRLSGLSIPSGATYAIINNSNVQGSDSTITYKYGVSIATRIDALEDRFVLVDKNGNGNFTTIAAAIDGTSDGATIFVNSGTYEEDVHMWGKTRHIVGLCRETCILTNGTGNYSTPPLEMNIGSIENMTIIADNYDPTIPDPTQNQVLPSYGIHIEYGNATPYTLTIRNCKILSKWCAGLGIGLRYNQTIIIDNCDLISEAVRIYSTFAGHWVEMGGLYFHNDNSNNVNGTGILRVMNSRIQGKKAALVMEAVNKTTMVDAEFDCDTLISEDYGVGDGIIYRYDNMPTLDGYLCGNKITLGIASHGNNIDELNA